MASPIVQIRGLTKQFGEFQALRGIDLDVAKGEVVAIIGPSGSGTTTLLRCVSLLERPDAGRLEVDGMVLVEETPRGVRYAKGDQIRRARTEIGMVFQHFHLFPHMTVVENIIDAPMSVRGLSRRQAEERALQLL